MLSAGHISPRAHWWALGQWCGGGGGGLFCRPFPSHAHSHRCLTGKKRRRAPRSADQSLHPFLLSRETAAAAGRFNQAFSYGGKGGSWGSTVVVRQREEDWRTGGKGGGGSFGTGLRMEGEEK